MAFQSIDVNSIELKTETENSYVPKRPCAMRVLLNARAAHHDVPTISIQHHGLKHFGIVDFKFVVQMFQ